MQVILVARVLLLFNGALVLRLFACRILLAEAVIVYRMISLPAPSTIKLFCKSQTDERDGR